MYCDPSLVEGGFCGEGLRGTNLLAVKTHDVSLQWKGCKVANSHKPMFDKAIYLLRNPFLANIAEWNRQLSNKHASTNARNAHVNYVTSRDFFGKLV